MERYKRRFTEYDPDKMRSLAGNKKQAPSHSKLPDWVVKDNQEGGDFCVEELANRAIHKDQNIFKSSHRNRIVCYQGHVYSMNSSDGIHLNIIAWLLMHAGLNIVRKEFIFWVDLGSKLPFLCLFQDDDNTIKFSESYKKSEIPKLIKYRNSHFKTEIHKLEQQGFIVSDRQA